MNLHLKYDDTKCPYKFILQRLLSVIYTSETEITTLVLFFASSMYFEKIAYANT